jgi:hypothetical protein
MNIYDQHTIPKVWADYLAHHKYPLNDDLALLVINNNKTGIIPQVTKWMTENNIPATRVFTFNGNNLVALLGIDQAAIMKLSIQ